MSRCRDRFCQTPQSSCSCPCSKYSDSHIFVLLRLSAMARKRARSGQGNEVEELDQDEQQQQAEQQQPAADRRAGMADIARRRAAHFAHFNDDAAEAEGNVHVGRNEARGLGPWSSAVELVNARQAAAEQRSKKIEQATQDQKAAEEVQWVPSRDPSLGPRASDPVQPLFQLALNLLVTHVDAVTSLWGVPDPIRSQIAAAVCARRKMSPDVAQLFGSDWTSELLLPDCTRLDPVAMTQLLQLAVAGQAADTAALPDVPEQQQHQCMLERLELGFCGRGFTDKAAAVLAAAGPLQQLRVLQLRGAYALSDSALVSVLKAAPGLTELAVPSASRLTGAFFSSLPMAAPSLISLDLSDCRGLPGAAIAAVLKQLKHLERLKLDGIPEVDAAVLSAAAQCPSLRAVSIAMCQHVDDSALTALAALSRSSAQPESSMSSAPHSALDELVLDECTAVSDAGLSAIVGACKALKVLTLRRCARITHHSLLPAIEKGTLEVLSVNGVHAVGSDVIQALVRYCRETLRDLDVSFCRDVSEGALGQLLDRCERLEHLRVYGCSQVTAKLLLGHSNDNVQIVGVSTSANA